jgi:hypothetical protein
MASTIEAIGNTPLVDLTRITRGVEGRILAKLENLNPGYSKKDRIARQIIEDAEISGDLSAGQTVVELTSGNTGTGLAIVCGIKGYPFVAVMSKGNSIERARMMSALGAEVVLVDQLPESVAGQVSGGDLELSFAVIFAPIICIPDRKSSTRAAGILMYFAILSAPAGHSQAVPRRSKNIAPTFNASSWSPKAPPF